MSPHWIPTSYCVVNLAQVCRIEYLRSDASREEIDGFDLYLADGTAVTLERGDGAFEQVLAELRDQEIEVAVGR